jgi:hypothetical protein
VGCWAELFGNARDRLSAAVPVIEFLEFDAQKGCLQLVEP